MGDSGVVPNQNPNNGNTNNFHHISAKVVINRGGALESAEDNSTNHGITVNGFFVNGGGVVGAGSSSNNTDTSSATSMTNEDSLSESGILMECERGQVESFFSGLGTEVSVEFDSGDTHPVPRP